MNNIQYVLFDQEKEETLKYLKNTLRPFFTKEILQWQFSNPRSFLMLAKEAHKIIGTQSMLYTELIYINNNKKDIIITYKSETTYVSEEFRGKGIFEILYNNCLNKTKNNNAKFVWGFTGIPLVLKNKLNFFIDESIIYEGKIIVGYHKKNLHKPKRFLVFIKDFFIANYTLLLKFLKKQQYKLQITNYSKTSQILPSVMNEMDDNKNLIRLHYSEEFCTWRIDENPVLNYKLLVFSHSNQKVGLVLYTTKNNSMMISAIHFSDIKYLSSIFNELYHEAKKNNLVKIFYFGNINNSINNEIFLQIKKFGGSIFLNKGMSFIIKSHHLENEIQYDNLQNWLINGLWTEGFTY